MYSAIASANRLFKRPRKRHILAFKPDEAVPRRFGCFILTVRCRRSNIHGKSVDYRGLGAVPGKRFVFRALTRGRMVNHGWF
jgi:hypothetical protein